MSSTNTSTSNLSALTPEALARDVTRKDPADRLVRHEKRPSWGVGLWVGEERTRRRVYFEDGDIRAFKKGFYHFLVPVDPDKVDVEALHEELRDSHEATLDENQRSERRVEAAPVMSFATQIAVFEHLYPGGFEGEAWVTAHRNPGESGRSRRGQVDRSIQWASELLSAGALARRNADNAAPEVYAELLELLAGCHLVKRANGVDLLRQVDEEGQRAVLAALQDLLHGEARYRRRFSAWLATLQNAIGTQPRWTLATVFPALVFPDEHLFVRHRVMELQEREIRVGASFSKRPRPPGYRAVRKIGRLARERLEAAGHTPRDLLDVSEFVWQTLRPGGQSVAAKLEGAAA